MITEQDRDGFTRGACFLLAAVVQEATSWPVAAFRDGFGPGGHAFNLMPDGRYLDIDGPQTRAEILARRGRGRRRVTTRHVRLDEWTLSWGDPAEWTGRAWEILPDLLATVTAQSSGRPELHGQES